MEKPLISAVVIAYQNGDLIYETLDSIFCQDYPEIELIISDDASNNNSFDVEEIKHYCELHAGENIKNTIVRINEERSGTVKHVEILREMEHGEIELLIAADDTWYDSTVFSSFIECFAKADWKYNIVVGQLGMYDHKLKNKKNDFMCDEITVLVQNEAYEELLERLAQGCILPACGTAIRRGVFERLGQMSHIYKLIEDYPFHIRAVKNGEKYGFLDKECAKHRDGGVSHGNTRMASLNQQIYLRDIITIIQLELLEEPRITPKVWKIANEHFLNALKHYVYVVTYVPPIDVPPIVAKVDNLKGNHTEPSSQLPEMVEECVQNTRPSTLPKMLKDIAWICVDALVRAAKEVFHIAKDALYFIYTIIKYKKRL